MEQPKSVEELREAFAAVPESDLLLGLFDKLAVPSTQSPSPRGGYHMRARACFGALSVTQTLDRDLISALNNKLIFVFLTGHPTAGLYLNLAELKPIEEIVSEPHLSDWDWDSRNYVLFSGFVAGRIGWNGEVLQSTHADTSQKWNFMVLPERFERFSHILHNKLPALPDYQASLDFLLHGELALLSLRKHGSRPLTLLDSADRLRSRYNKE